jgi:hypothetical protein
MKEKKERRFLGCSVVFIYKKWAKKKVALFILSIKGEKEKFSINTNCHGKEKNTERSLLKVKSFVNTILYFSLVLFFIIVKDTCVEEVFNFLLLNIIRNS